jgi:dipeptidyl aminopeptidase/acylaminoacyl peptidase
MTPREILSQSGRCTDNPSFRARRGISLSSWFSRHSPLATRHFLLRILSALCVLCVNSSFFLWPARAQNLDKPLQSIDEEVTSFSYAPDGRIVYGVYRRVKNKKFDALEHDDIWIQDVGGKRRRLLEGQKYERGTQAFSYLINSFHWSPNGRMVAVSLFITSVDADGRATDSFQTLLYDDNGKEIRVAKGDNILVDAAEATWLQDNNTIAYLSEVTKPRLLFSLNFTLPTTGKLPSPYEGRTFRDIDWLAGANAAIAVEQDQSMRGPSRLQRLDLLKDNAKELTTLEGFEGGLSISPSGKKVAYFVDRENLEIRDLASPNLVARARVGLGVYHWSADESYILLKRAVEKKSGDLVWIALPPLAAVPAGHEIPIAQPQPISILHGLSVREFAISPDGRTLSVVLPGKRNLQVFPLTR